MKVNKANLQRALEIVKPGLASKELIEQSTSFAFVDGRVVTYNDEISISHPVEGLELTGAVKAEQLYQLLGKIKSEEMEISVEGSEILITSGKSKAGLTLQTEIKLPLDEEIAHKEKWKKLPENFLRLVSFAMTSCGRDMSQPILTCINVAKEGYIEASDSFRIVKCEIGEKMPVKTFLLPASSAISVCKLKPNKVAEGKGWIHFQTEAGTVMSCRIFEDTFPDTSKHLVVKGIEIILPKTIQEILERATIFAKRDTVLDEEVKITLENKKLKIRGESDSGWFEEEVPFRYTGEPVTFYITPYLLKGILSETLTGTLGKDKLKFEGKDWIYATVLRVK